MIFLGTPIQLGAIAVTRGQFYQCFTSNFCTQRSQKGLKIQSSCKCIFVLLGSVLYKVARKMLVKSNLAILSHYVCVCVCGLVWKGRDTALWVCVKCERVLARVRERMFLSEIPIKRSLTQRANKHKNNNDIKHSCSPTKDGVEPVLFTYKNPKR